jgi:hypothetical protein
MSRPEATHDAIRAAYFKGWLDGRNFPADRLLQHADIALALDAWDRARDQLSTPAGSEELKTLLGRNERCDPT